MSSLGQNRCWAEIDCAALRHNARVARERVGTSTSLLAVVKANGYGHGMVEVAKNEELRGREEIQGLTDYLLLREQMKHQLAERATQGGAKTLEARSNLDLADMWDDATMDLRDRNGPFADLFHRSGVLHAILYRDTDITKIVAFATGSDAPTGLQRQAFLLLHFLEWLRAVSHIPTHSHIPTIAHPRVIAYHYQVSSFRSGRCTSAPITIGSFGSN